MAEVKNITITVIFEGHALNRDEKLAGNIQSIKKLSYIDRQVSYISRPAIRHYLFNTLRKAYPEDWKEASVTTQGDVIQFDITKEDIFTSAELDAFGYMYTISGENSITRKAPIGITKAVSLVSYNNDMAFYANHDLVKRASMQGDKATPNPNQKEENMSLYRVSFTVDAKFIGTDEWIVQGEPKYDNSTKKLTIEKPVKKTFENVEKENDNIYLIRDSETVHSMIFEEINSNQVFRLTFQLSETTKKRRIQQILQAIHDGLVAHSSGEDNTIVPLFMIAAPVRVPSPVFHSYIYLDLSGNKPEVRGLDDCFRNSWLEDKVYVYISERFNANLNSFKDKLYKSWEEFLKSCGISEESEINHASASP